MVFPNILGVVIDITQFGCKAHNMLATRQTYRQPQANYLALQIFLTYTIAFYQVNYFKTIKHNCTLFKNQI